MVPGMTERERLAAEQRRLTWLAEARFGPAQPQTTPIRRVSQSKPHHASLLLFRNAIGAALAAARRVRPAQLNPLKRASESAAASAR